jgi:hypothetical protein
MQKILFVVLFVVSFFLEISSSSAFTVSKGNSLFGGGAFGPVYGKQEVVHKTEDGEIREYQKVIAERLFKNTYSVERSTIKVSLNDEIKQVEASKNKPLEVQIREYLGLQWNFDCDNNVVEYFDENKIGSNLTLYFTLKEKGMTRIYFDLVADGNNSDVLETRYLDVFIDKDIKNEEIKN